MAAARQLLAPTAGWRSTATSSSTSTTAPPAPPAPTRSASRAATARPRSSNDQPSARPYRRHPLEETLASITPALLLTFGAASATLRLAAPRAARRLRLPRAHEPPNCQKEVVMATFAVTAEHPPDLCPTSNAQTRQILKDGASQIGSTRRAARRQHRHAAHLRPGPHHPRRGRGRRHRSRQGLRPPESPHAMEHREDPCHVFDRGGSRAAGHGGDDLLERAGAKSTATPSDAQTLSLRRVLRAPRPVVFEAFCDPSELAKWWGPKGFTTPSLEFGPRVGEQLSDRNAAAGGRRLPSDRRIPRGRTTRPPCLHVRLGGPRPRRRRDTRRPRLSGSR